MDMYGLANWRDHSRLMKDYSCQFQVCEIRSHGCISMDWNSLVNKPFLHGHISQFVLDKHIVWGWTLVFWLSLYQDRVAIRWYPVWSVHAEWRNDSENLPIINCCTVSEGSVPDQFVTCFTGWSLWWVSAIVVLHWRLLSSFHSMLESPFTGTFSIMFITWCLVEMMHWIKYNDVKSLVWVTQLSLVYRCTAPCFMTVYPYRLCPQVSKCHLRTLAEDISCGQNEAKAFFWIWKGRIKHLLLFNDLHLFSYCWWGS